MIRHRWTASLAALAILASPALTRAEVTPNPLFSNGAVLQRDATVPIWGTGDDDGEEVTVRFQGREATSTTKDGRWVVCLEDLEVGGPYTLQIRSGDQEIAIKNVLVGDVWLCSGQSNMQWSLNATTNGEQAIAGSADSELRLLTVPRVGKGEPQSSVDVGWSEAAPETVPGFSAVGYYFGARLREDLDVPIGLISTNVGGTPAEAWTEPEDLAQVAELQPILERPENGARRTAPAGSTTRWSTRWFPTPSRARSGTRASRTPGRPTSTGPSSRR